MTRELTLGLDLDVARTLQAMMRRLRRTHPGASDGALRAMAVARLRRVLQEASL
jgi:hypothetical protein